MKTYEISGIKVGIEYIFDQFLVNNIEKYEKNVNPNHFIYVHLVDEITLPYFNSTIIKGNKHYYRDNEKEFIYTQHKNGYITDWIEYDYEYKKVDIFLKNNELRTLPEIEYILIGVVFLEIALLYGMIPIHASSISYNGQAILFSAPSKTGKSTIAKRFMNLYPTSILINDDKPLISYIEGMFNVSSSPFSGKTSENQNIVTPLKSIIFLHQSTTNELVKLDNDQKVLYIMKNILRPKDLTNWDKIMSNINQLITLIPMYVLYAKNDDEAVELVKYTLFKGE